MIDPDDPCMENLLICKEAIKIAEPEIQAETAPTPILVTTPTETPNVTPTPKLEESPSNITAEPEKNKETSEHKPPII